MDRRLGPTPDPGPGAVAGPGGRRRSTPAVLLAAAVLLGGAMAVLQQALPGRTPADELSRALDRAVAGGAPDPADAAAARRALDAAPLQPGALTLLGLAAERNGDGRRAGLLMSSAVALDRRDVVARLWLFNAALASVRYGDAIGQADALMRLNGKLSGPLQPSLLALAGQPGAAEPFAHALAARPPWRPGFLQALAGAGQPPGAPKNDPQSATPILLALQATAAPPTPDEVSDYVGRMAEAHGVPTAYLAWLLLTPPGAIARMEAVYDGDFDQTAAPPPFGWSLATGADASASVVDAPSTGRGRTLEATTSGGATSELAHQLLLLGPGAYILRGEVMAAEETPGAATAWSLTCAGGAVRAAQPLTARSGSWSWFAVPFVVPQACPVQRMVLSGAPGQGSAHAVTWYAELAVTEAGATTRVPRAARPS